MPTNKFYPTLRWWTNGKTKRLMFKTSGQHGGFIDNDMPNNTSSPDAYWVLIDDPVSVIHLEEFKKGLHV